MRRDVSFRAAELSEVQSARHVCLQTIMTELLTAHFGNASPSNFLASSSARAQQVCLNQIVALAELEHLPLANATMVLTILPFIPPKINVLPRMLS